MGPHVTSESEIGSTDSAALRTSRACLRRLATTLLKDEESARDNHVLPSNFATHSQFGKKNFAGRLGNKLFLIFLAHPVH